MSDYNYIKICAKPVPLEVALDEDHHTEVLREIKLAHKAPDLLALLESALFQLESVAHLRGLERELLPFVDMARDEVKGLK